MPTKQETLDTINPQTTYLGSYVKKMINELTLENKAAPEYLKKGDVIVIKGVKNRPATIIRVRKEYVIVIPMTSSENVHCLSESKSRFFSEGCFCNSFEVVPIDLALSSFVGIYDNMKLLNNAIKELRNFISKNI